MSEEVAPESPAPESRDDDYLVLDRLDKFFGSLHVLRDFELRVSQGEIVALLGPSGSGKTTVLRILAGFEQPDHGTIRVAGEEVQALPPARRGFGMVFQSYALFPHLTVERNVAFGLEILGRSRSEIADRVETLLELVELPGLGGRRVSEISGGQQQRVALARALAPQPRVLMLDEPLSNLDPALRERTRRVLRRAIKETGITTVLVTHEQDEAFELGDRVGVLHEGRLDQHGVPSELYERPATRFVASFVGRTSQLEGVVEAVDENGVRVRVLGEGSEAGIATWPGASEEALLAGDPVELVARPEGLRFTDAEDPEGLPGVVERRRYTGAFTYFTVALDLGSSVELLGSTWAAREGERVRVSPRPGMTPRVFPRQRSVG